MKPFEEHFWLTLLRLLPSCPFQLHIKIIYPMDEFMSLCQFSQKLTVPNVVEQACNLFFPEAEVQGPKI